MGGGALIFDFRISIFDWRNHENRIVRGIPPLAKMTVDDPRPMARGAPIEIRKSKIENSHRSLI
jgi:hypothetical protein